MIDRFFINLGVTQFLVDSVLTYHPHRFTPKAKGVLISSCGFPEMENFSIISQHYKKWMNLSGLTWAGDSYSGCKCC